VQRLRNNFFDVNDLRLTNGIVFFKCFTCDTYLEKERIKRRYCDYCRTATRQTLHDKLLSLRVRANRSTKERNNKENREKTECTITYDDLKDQIINQQGNVFTLE